MNRKSVVTKKASDLARIDRMKDADIDYSDIPRLDKTFFKRATMAWPPAKKQLTIRLDEDLKRQKKLTAIRDKRAARRPKRPAPTPAPAPVAAAPSHSPELPAAS